MTPREVLAAHLGDDLADLAIAALKDASLFIGPDRATREMIDAAERAGVSRIDAEGGWREIRAEWNKEEGPPR